MRHRKGFNHLGRTDTHRKAMLANMAASLIVHKRITTTTAKAKALRSYVEPLLTKSKDDSTHSRRVVFSYLQDKNAVSELFREISPKIADRPGGYTRILKTGNRLGDNAEMCIIELVDFNENMLDASAGTKAKSTRRGRRGKKKTETEILSQPESVEEEKADEIAGEEEVTAQSAAEETKEEVKAEEVEETAAPQDESAAEEVVDAASEEVKSEEEVQTAPADDVKAAEEVQAKADTEEQKKEEESPADKEENKKEE